MNTTIERIYQILGNLLYKYKLQETYLYDADSRMEILVEYAFMVRATYHSNKIKSPGQLVFNQYMILPINHVANWRYICQRKQLQIEKYFIHENSIRINYDYRVGDQVIMKNKAAYKYKTTFIGMCKRVSYVDKRISHTTNGSVHY